MAGMINPSTIMEEEEEDQFSTQNNNPRTIEEERRMNNKTMFDQLLMNNNKTGGKDTFSTTPKINQAQRGMEIDMYQQQDEEGNCMEEINYEYEIDPLEESQKIEELPDEIKQILQYDESLLDLMRHKSHFKFTFGKELQLLSQLNISSQTQQENPIIAGLELLNSSYICFNAFFFQKQQLYQKSVLEIHHSQTTEKVQLYNFIISELLRDQAEKEVSDQKQIAPEILFFDNTQQINYNQIKQMIKQKLALMKYYRQSLASQNSQQNSQLKDESQDAMFESISENCLQKLHVIESHSQLEFCTNIRSIKHILSKKKQIRIVIIDEINAFYVDNESAFTAHHHKTPTKEDEDAQQNQQNYKKKKKVATTHHHMHHKTNINKQYDQLVKEYLQDIYRKYNRVCFIQSRRDYFKVRNLIEYTENTFTVNDELMQLFSKDDLDMVSSVYKNEKEYELQNVYCLSLDNFSNLAIEKVLDLIRNDQINADKYVNPQKVSVIIKRNYITDDEDRSSQEINRIKEFRFQMGFYTFEKGEFRPLSDNLFYLN